MLRNYFTEKRTMCTKSEQSWGGLHGNHLLEIQHKMIWLLTCFLSNEAYFICVSILSHFSLSLTPSSLDLVSIYIRSEFTFFINWDSKKRQWLIYVMFQKTEGSNQTTAYFSLMSAWPSKQRSDSERSSQVHKLNVQTDLILRIHDLLAHQGKHQECHH